MDIIFVLIPLAVIIVAIAIGVFFWAVRSNQFDDLDRQGYSILFDDDIKKGSTLESDTASQDQVSKHKNDPLCENTSAKPEQSRD